MKKIILSFVVAFFLFLPMVKADNEKVQVYIFKGDGCPHCEDALEFFNGLTEEEKAMFELNEYEVWYNEDNKEMMKKVAEKLEETASGVPYIIVGNQSFKGFDDETGASVLTMIREMYENQDLTDIVSEFIPNNSSNNLVVIGFVGCIVVVVLLVILARKRNEEVV